VEETTQAVLIICSQIPEIMTYLTTSCLDTTLHSQHNKTSLPMRWFLLEGRA